MSDKMKALDLLRASMKDATADFRPGQWEAIDALVNRRERLLVVQRTGWGKSTVYFIATRMLRDRGRGPTLIVSPLLALMRNQIDAAERLGVHALTINSTNKKDWPILKRVIHNNEADVLLISPERLADDTFVEAVLMPTAGQISMLVVDEAHCISDWGHDFRPNYRRLFNILQHVPGNTPVLGTTATANDRVVEDIRVQFGDIGIQRGDLMRETLALQTLRLPSKAARLAWLADHINTLPGTGIIYTLTKRDANQVADWLQENNVTAHAYYSGVSSDDFENSDSYRQHLEGQLLRNELKVLVATTALGMGYDKPDLGFVIHYQAPDSIVAYYQQVGRAGRGIDKAVGILLSGNEDGEIQEYFRKTAFPKEQWVDAILKALEQSDGLSIKQLEDQVNLRQGQISDVLNKYLSFENPAPIIKSGYTWRRTAAPYRMNHEKIRWLTERREREWQEIQKYITEAGCLMKFLATALDDANLRACGKCASCLGRPIVEPSFTRETAITAARFLRHFELVLKCKIQVAKDAFPEYGFSGDLPHKFRAEAGRILSRWGDAGWGQLVADDKHDGRLRDELVDAVVEMLNDRWQPTPPPEWVTCVPSRNRSDLVPDYARRLATAQGLPFEPIITKVKDNQQQKTQQNSFHQCRNLDGVFNIDGPVAKGPVLLVDDIVDSGWTLTIIAALLRQSGSGPVFPLALASSNTGA